MHDSRLHAWHLGQEAGLADDHRARHRAQAVDRLAARRRARLGAFLALLLRPRAIGAWKRRPAPDPCSEKPKAAA